MCVRLILGRIRGRTSEEVVMDDSATKSLGPLPVHQPTYVGKMLYQLDACFGKCSSLIHAEHVHTAEIIDGCQTLHERADTLGV